jgi:hypothetical protein
MSHLRLVWDRSWIDALYEPGSFALGVLKAAYESVENPNLGPLPEDEMAAFLEQVRALDG